MTIFENNLYGTLITTPLGKMLAIANDEALCLLEFADRARLPLNTQANIYYKMNTPLKTIAQELKDYFKGNLYQFKTPLLLQGTVFQSNVWAALQSIPYGQTQSYLHIATKVGNIKACRAVARANAANQIAIVIPCHRVINQSGKIGGYAGGIERKEWLLEHERQG